MMGKAIIVIYLIWDLFFKFHLYFEIPNQNTAIQWCDTLANDLHTFPFIKQSNFLIIKQLHNYDFLII